MRLGSAFEGFLALCGSPASNLVSGQKSVFNDGAGQGAGIGRRS
jgi:hypothetical protein